MYDIGIIFYLSGIEVILLKNLNYNLKTMFKIKISVTRNEEFDDLFIMEQSVTSFVPWLIADKFLDLSHELNVYEDRKIVGSDAWKLELEKLAKNLSKD